MSKKTDAAKRKARTGRKPKRHPRRRINRMSAPRAAKTDLPMSDPIFLGHVAGAILRYLEMYPAELTLFPASGPDYLTPRGVSLKSKGVPTDGDNNC